MKTRPLAPTIVLTLMLAGLAGCVSSESKSPPLGSGAQPAAPAEFDEATGAVEGLVVNEEYMPLVAAVVGLRGKAIVDGEERNVDEVAIADAGGKYSISRIPPGEYTILANALGYEAQASKILVEAGKIVTKSWTLIALPVEGPWVDQYSVKGSITRGASWKLTHPCIYEPLTGINPLLKTCGGIVHGTTTNQEIGLGSRKNPTAPGELEPDWATILVQLIWKQQTAVVGRSLQLDILFPNITRATNGAANQADPRYFQEEDYTSPINLRINRATMEERKIVPDDQYGNVRSRVFVAAADLGTHPSGPDVGVMTEQTFTYWVTLAYSDPLADGYTAIPDQ